jgi:stalled ribosome alternative rescue factor ArfA
MNDALARRSEVEKKGRGAGGEGGGGWLYLAVFLFASLFSPARSILRDNACDSLLAHKLVGRAKKWEKDSLITPHCRLLRALPIRIERRP